MPYFISPAGAAVHELSPPIALIASQAAANMIASA
jgi:hypothetical protein